MLVYRNLRFSERFLASLVERKFSSAERAAIMKTLASLDDAASQNGLRIHRLKGNRAGLWSVSASKSIRITFVRAGGGLIELDDVTRHYDD